MKAHREINCIVAFDASGEKFLASTPDGVINVKIDFSAPVTVKRCRRIFQEVCRMVRREDIVAINIIHNIYSDTDDSAPLVYSLRWDYDSRTDDLITRVYDVRH